MSCDNLMPTFPEKSTLRPMCGVTTSLAGLPRSSASSMALDIVPAQSAEYEDRDGKKFDTSEQLECYRTTYDTFRIDRSDDEYRPDVGFRPWMVVVGGFFGQFCSFGLLNVVGIFIAYYQHNQLKGLSPSTISWIGSIQSFTFSFSGLFCGRIADMYGPRFVAAGGCFFITVGMLAIAFCQEYYQFVLAQGICTALGAAGLFYGPTAAISGWFSLRRGLAFGISASGASIGGICLSLIFESLSQKSFQAAVYAITAVLFAFSVATTIATSSRIKPTGTQSYRFVKFYVRPFLEPAFSLYTVSMFLIFLGLFVPMAYFASSAIAEGVSVAHSFQIVTYFNIGSFFGRTLLGLLSDKVNKFALFSAITFVSGLVCAPFWYFSHSETTITVIAVAYGFFTGGILAMFSMLVAQISPVQEIGTRLGAVNGSVAFATLVSLPIAGAIVESNRNYDNMKIYAGVVLIAGAIVAASVNLKIPKHIPRPNNNEGGS
ncbi:major facilitator superfamily domain-containing protein [Lipomyces kononenkoae]|uniref:Major facilitator superfamily domain-containing protein n=1 Tax=Lipomyces kononenkoae TaxID=34357 RepID=A0ACC3T5A6_LIPKO